MMKMQCRCRPALRVTRRPSLRKPCVPPSHVVRVVPSELIVDDDDSSGVDDVLISEDEVLALPTMLSNTLTAVKSVIISYGAGQSIELQTGEVARQAGGAVMATSGDTTILATACASRDATGDGSFLPLQVHYSERLSAAGKTAGGFIKRDGRPNQVDTLASRLVDRSLRPLFAKGWASDTQVLEWVLSYDPGSNPQPLAITAAAAALLISDIPFHRAVAGVQVGLIPGIGFVVNPSAEQMVASQLDLMMAGTADAVLMIEGFCDFLTDEQMVEAIALGHASIAQICLQLQTWAATVAKTKSTKLVPALPWLSDAVAEVVGAELEAAYQVSHKQTRGKMIEGIRSRVASVLLERFAEQGVKRPQIDAACKALEGSTMRMLLRERGIRPDGRAVDQVRPIASRCSVLPRTHGSSLFTRGETQAICVTTLGSEEALLRGESLMKTYDESATRFYLQYHFPPSCVNEVGRMGGPGRREVGHGMLAQRALAPIIPEDPIAFPYVVRLESHITDSNGSSSMASVCGGCLALLDAGVPVKRRVAGIAMGLVLEPDGSYVVLTDILGLEDALGDMDFKVAGDADTLTAFQMDIKVEGITMDIIRGALAAARKGRVHILQEMDKCHPPPRLQLSPWAPIIRNTMIPREKIGGVIGSGGKVIRGIMEQFGVDVNVDDAGMVRVTAPSLEQGDKVLTHIKEMTMDLAVGMELKNLEVIQIIDGTGAILELPGGRDGMVHISELSIEPVQTVEEVVQLGQKVDAIVISESMGKYKLSIADVKRKALGMEPKDRSRGFGGRGAGRGRSGAGRGTGGRAPGRGRGSDDFNRERSDGGRDRGRRSAGGEQDDRKAERPRDYNRGGRRADADAGQQRATGSAADAAAGG